ncbi:MAG: GAF domain-containing protein [Thermoleophilaceae bacterium]
MSDPVELGRLAAEQAALRRVATLVGEGAPAESLFAVVAEEVARVLDVPVVSILRYETDGVATECASFSDQGEMFPVGTRWSLTGTNVVARVRETGRPARINDYTGLRGIIAETVRRAGLRSTVGIPIVVAGRLWGAMVVSSAALEPLVEDTEARLADFTELVATAIANSDARAEVGRLLEEQAALRRVATLVAQGVPATELFRAVTQEVGTLLGADLAGMIRYEGNTVISVATWAAVGEREDIGNRWPLEEGRLGATIAKTGRPARIDDYSGVPGRITALVRDVLGVRSSVGTPIVVEGQLWGVLVVHSTHDEPLPADTEWRLVNFTELVATAASNAQARADVQRLADEQAALRRVATLVARESSPAEVFAAVAEEVALLLGTGSAVVQQFEPDGAATVVASEGDLDTAFPIGSRWTLDGKSITAVVHRTGRPARLDDYSEASGPLGNYVRSLGFRCAVGGPIVVDGRLWGAMVAATLSADFLPVDAESRIEEFAELVATAISNVQARSELRASRARIVAATDEERRRVVRDLHDGAQQRLVHTVITLKLAQKALQTNDDTAPALVSDALEQAESAMDELRELAHGILPSVLTLGGLRAGVEALASRMPIPIETEVSVGRLPAELEATAYFVVAEALTNVAKHSQATRAAVVARIAERTLCIDVRDDGTGGARADGSGLLGLGDRLSVLDGELRVESPADSGTLVAATIPLPG